MTHDRSNARNSQVRDIVAQFDRKKHVFFFFFNNFVIVDLTFELILNVSLAFYVLKTRFVVLSHRVIFIYICIFLYNIL